MKKDGHLSLLVRDYNENKSQYNKQSGEEILLQRVVKTTIQIIKDKSLFFNFQNADEVSKDLLFTTRLRADLEEVIDVIQ